MFKFSVAFILFLVGFLSLNAQTKWMIDKAHSKVQFSATHLIISEVTGEFKNFDGSIETNGDDFSNAKVNFTIDVSSISTDNEQRDNHLKSD